MAVIYRLLACLFFAFFYLASFSDGTEAQTPALTPDEMFQDMFPLTQENFTQSLLGIKDPWIVLFHNGEIDKSWKTLAVNLRGIVWVGLVDKSDESILQEMKYTAERDSVARVYPYGGKQKKLNKWVPAKTPNEARSKVIAFIPDRSTEVTPDTIQDFLMSCVMALPTRFPALYITDEKSTTPLIKALSVRFEKYFNFGRMVNPSPEDLASVGLDTVYVDTPSLFILLPDQSDPSRFNAVQYDRSSFGHMNYTSVMQFLFAINSNFRHQLLGDNQSTQQQEAEMSDVLDIEKQRFDIVYPGKPNSNVNDKSSSRKPEVKFSFGSNLSQRDEL